MRAMVLDKQNTPLSLRELPVPEPRSGEVQVKVAACGICRTDLHVVDGDLTEPNLPLIPGHQIVGMVSSIGEGVTSFKIGDRVGIPWLGGSCGICEFCATGQENLCDKAVYTGYQINGGFAEFCVADERFCFPIPEGYPDIQAAPLLCAGLIGYRAYRRADQRERIGLYGFGAAAHILTQLAVWQNRRVFAFSREGDNASRDFALTLGAHWSGWSNELPPDPLDAAIIFAPVGALVPQALKAVRRGGRVICAGIHMSEIPAFPYSILWGERSVESIANLTRRDGEEFLALAPRVPINTEVTVYPLEQANTALDDLRAGRFNGAAVLDLGL